MRRAFRSSGVSPASAVGIGLFVLFLCSAVHAEDTITLKDGRAISGTIVKEDDESVFITQNGEQRGIAKSRIAKIERGAKPAAAAPAAEPKPADPKAAGMQPPPAMPGKPDAPPVVQKPGAPEPI
ncbi:MAG TPA: hypothetical protein VEJ63_19020, partial [Planctomycetota bacterium]|nr:hypothetical protein [Planctomycetota bacterium]